MKLEFADPLLKLIETDRAFETALPVAVISTARTRLQIVRAAPDFKTLVNWRSFGLRSDGRLGAHLIPITDAWHMDITFKVEGEPVTVLMGITNIALAGRA